MNKKMICKLFEESPVRTDYLEILKSKEANTFLSEKELKKRTKPK